MGQKVKPLVAFCLVQSWMAIPHGSTGIVQYVHIGFIYPRWILSEMAWPIFFFGPWDPHRSNTFHKYGLCKGCFCDRISPAKRVQLSNNIKK
jgi:hypothetical protein